MYILEGCKDRRAGPQLEGNSRNGISAELIHANIPGNFSLPSTSLSASPAHSLRRSSTCSWISCLAAWEYTYSETRTESSVRCVTRMDFPRWRTCLVRLRVCVRARVCIHKYTHTRTHIYVYTRVYMGIASNAISASLCPTILHVRIGEHDETVGGSLECFLRLAVFTDQLLEALLDRDIAWTRGTAPTVWL